MRCCLQRSEGLGTTVALRRSVFALRIFFVSEYPSTPNSLPVGNRVSAGSGIRRYTVVIGNIGTFYIPVKAESWVFDFLAAPDSLRAYQRA